MSLSVFYKNWNSLPRFLFLPGGRRKWLELRDVCVSEVLLQLNQFHLQIFSQFVHDVSHVLQPHLFILLSWDRWVFSIKGRWLRKELHRINKHIFKLNTRSLCSRKPLILPQLDIVTVHFSPEVFSLILSSNILSFSSCSSAFLLTLLNTCLSFIQRSLAFPFIVLTPGSPSLFQ